MKKDGMTLKVVSVILQLKESDIFKVIMPFPAGLADGFDGLKRSI
jgi:hypothetical protein